MSKIKEVYKEFRFTVRDVLHNSRNRKKLENHGFSIICSDCTAGCICKDLKEQMRSPTRIFISTQTDTSSFARILNTI